MRRNLSHIIAAAFNEPLLLEPAYARVFFCALGREMGAASLSVPQQQVQLDAPGMLAETDEYMAGGKRPARVYRVVNGIVFSRQWRIARCGAYCWTLTVRAGRPPARLTALT